MIDLCYDGGVIELHSVSRMYHMGSERLAALDNVSLTIPDGEFLAIVGPSGSGKSTLANIIGGLDRPTAGKVAVDGHDLARASDHVISTYRNRRVGFVFQAFNLLPHYTALENVMVPLILARVRPRVRKAKATACLKEVGLEHRLRHKPGELSGGERQRVSIARAIANDPAILIADEPTGNLDSKKGAEIVALLKKLNKDQHITLIVITHDPTIAKQADRVIKIQDGQVR